MPSIADLRRIEEERQEPTTTLGPPAPSPDDILRKWQKIWDETRDAVWPGPPVSPPEQRQQEWWEREDGYEGGEGRQPDLPLIPQFGEEGISSPDPVATQPEEGLNPWQRIWSGVRRQVEQEAEYVAQGLEEIRESPRNALNILFGNPFDIGRPAEGPRGVVWKAAFDAPAEATRRVAGFIVRSNPFDMMTGRLERSVNLALGTYDDLVQMMAPSPDTPEEEYQRRLQQANEIQSSYDQRVQELMDQGHGAVGARWRALRETGQKIEEMEVEERPERLLRLFKEVREGLPEATQAFETGERILPWSARAEEAWRMAQGYRYTHSIRPELGKQYEMLVDQGWDPAEAGAATEDTALERWCLTIADPNWKLNLDNLAWKPALWGIKKVGGLAGKGVLGVATRIPVVRTGVHWMMSLSAQTAGNYAARHVDDIAREGARWLNRNGMDVTGEAIEGLMRNPPSGFLSELPNYYRRALAGVRPYLDDVAEILQKRMGEEVVEKALKNVTDPVRVAQVIDGLLEDAVGKASGVAYSKAVDAVARRNPWLERGFLRWLQRNAITRTMTSFNSIAVDTWLGLRPSWNVFNMVDNMVKLTLDGISPITSVPNMLRRYGAYMEGAGAWADEVEALRKTHFWDLRPGVSEQYSETLRKMVPRQVTGSFATDVRRHPSKLRELPGVGAMIDWQMKLGERIESTFRTRAYLHHFFDALDSGWDDVVRRPITAEIGDAAIPLSEEAAQALRTRLGAIDNPTVPKVKAVLGDLLRSDRMEVVVPKLGAGVEETFQYLDDDLVKSAQTALNDLVRMGDAGPRVVTLREIDEVLDGVATDLVNRYNETIRAGMRTLDDMLPEMPETVDEMLGVLTAGADDVTMEHMARAVDDMPMLEKRFHVEWNKKLADHWQKIQEAKEQGVSGLLRGKMHDEFFEARMTAWEDFVDKQQELLTDLADRIDDMLPEGKLFPRVQIFDEYLEAADRLNLLEMERNRLKKRFGVFTGQGRFQEAELSVKQFDDMFRQVKPGLDAKIHDTLVSARQWFQSEGLEMPEILDLDELGRGAGWWRVDQQLKDIPESARKVLDDQLAELRRWRQAIMDTRVRPYSMTALTDFDRQIMSDYGGRLLEDTRGLISDAQDVAVQKVNDLLFDYETTPNWMNLLGKFIPFVRFPVKNIPLWADKFAEVPHMIGGVANIRRLQAAINKQRGVPTRHQYSIALPRKLTDPLMEALGFHNTELRFNPWSFISVFQQMPGGTPYKARQLTELHTDERDQAWRGNMESVTTYMQQLGFGMWPWVEWALGTQGLLGDSWYPRGVFSTWSPVVNWAANSVFGYPRNWDIDQHMRSVLPRFWNAVFGGTNLAWDAITPDLMEQWLTGREVEGVIMQLPDDPEALASLAQVSPMEIRQIIQTLEANNQLFAVRHQVVPVFEMELEQQAEALRNMTPEQQAVFLDEMQRIAARKAIQKSAFTTFMGNLTGMYLEPAGMAEVEARKLRYEKRREKEILDVGPEQRDFERQFREEHPKYGLVQTWRFGQYPWGETVASREAELWDSLIQSAENEYWDWRGQFDAQRERAIEEFYRTRPGDKQGLKALKNRLREERLAKEEYYNQRLMDELQARMEDYIRHNPHDVKGIEKLRHGFDTDMYVGTHLTPEQRRKLREFRKANPDNEEGLNELFGQMWDEAQRLSPPTQPKRWPGLDEGFTMNLKWNPSSYSQEEVQGRLIGDIIRELADNAPDREEYEDSEVWWEEFNGYLDNLSDRALELDEVQQQVDVLMQNSGMTRQEAEQTVRAWYTREQYDEHWRQFHNKWEALENAYQERWISEWDDRWYGQIAKLREEDYTLYAAAREELFSASGPLPATEFIAYVMDMYPGRWTVAELQAAYDGVTMPSYEDRRRLRLTGEKALDAHVWYFYNQLPGEGKRIVRERFGDAFSSLFLGGESDQVSPELRGDWITALSQMVGQPFDWHQLPGIEDLLEEKGSKREAHDFGLPRVGAPNEAEFEQAQRLEREYWRLRAAGDERYKQFEDHPLRKKWFGTSTPKGYFWTYYYDQIPPGWVAKELRNHPAIQIVLDRDVRYAVSEDRDYDRAVEVMENWMMFNADRLAELGFNPAEYDLARQLMNKYYEIPYENKAERRAFLDGNPLLRKYLFEPKSSRSGGGSTSRGGGSRRGGGGGGSRQVSVNYDALWSAFRQQVGESYSTVMGMLASYWKNGEFSGPKTKTYLRDLHAKIGGDLDFEDWLDVLRRIYASMNERQTSAGGRSAGEPRQPPRPRYSTGSGGRRRI